MESRGPDLALHWRTPAAPRFFSFLSGKYYRAIGKFVCSVLYISPCICIRRFQTCEWIDSDIISCFKFFGARRSSRCREAIGKIIEEKKSLICEDFTHFPRRIQRCLF